MLLTILLNVCHFAWFRAQIASKQNKTTSDYNFKLCSRHRIISLQLILAFSLHHYLFDFSCLLFSLNWLWNDYIAGWLDVFHWTHVVRIGWNLLRWRNYSSLYEKKIQPDAKPVFIHFKSKKSENRRANIYILCISNDGRREGKKKAVYGIFASPNAMIFILFVLVQSVSQSVTHSFIFDVLCLFLSLSLFTYCVSVSVCALCMNGAFLWCLLSKIFRIFFIMRCSLSGYQFWSKEFIELASRSHPKCGVRASESVKRVLVHVFIRGKLKLKFKANRTASKNPPNSCIKIAQNLFTTRFHT